MRGVWVAVLLASGCLSAPSRGEGDGESDGDGGAGDDAGSAEGDAGPVVPCGTLSAVRETFDELSPFDWVVFDGTTVDAGALVLAPDDDQPKARLLGNAAWLIEGGALEVEVDVDLIAADAALWLSLWQGADRVALALSSGALEAWVVDTDGARKAGSVAFVAEQMTWWRLSHDGEQYRWATSGDGTSWTERGTIEADMDGLARVGLEHDFGGSETEVRVRSINTLQPTSKPCPVSTLVEPFTLDTGVWESTFSGSCSVTIAGSLAVSTSTTSYFCGLASNPHFTMTDQGVSVELVEAASCGQRPSLEVLFDGGAFTLGCNVDGGMGAKVAASAVVGGDPVGSATEAYDAEHRYLAIRDEGAAGVSFETSPDGQAWVELLEVPAAELDGVDLEVVELRVGAHTISSVPPTEEVVFDTLEGQP